MILVCFNVLSLLAWKLIYRELAKKCWIDTFLFHAYLVEKKIVIEEDYFEKRLTTA